jgi:APA family basic amino acid/polyamine antiporter
MESDGPDRTVDRPPSLRRELGVFGASMMGVGAMVGTGVFVSVGIAAGVTGPSVVLAVALAAVVATCNALSSAQLAAKLPVSGGTYEYGREYLNSWFGFTAGWMFLCAKTASAATAALGFAGYLLGLTGGEGLAVPVGIATVAAMTLIVVLGIRRSSRANIVIVSITLGALAVFVATGAFAVLSGESRPWTPFFSGSEAPLPGLLHATALMFVAFTGYARIATLGEEVHDPAVTIPRAILITLTVVTVLYLAVAAIGIATVGADVLSQAAEADIAPLAIAARAFSNSGVALVVSIGAMTAMLGVLLNLLLGLSRIALAMGRRGDLPRALAAIRGKGSPVVAVIVVAVGVGALVLTGSVRTTWSFSAFTVLIYYSITNLAALRLEPGDRLYSPLYSWVGLVACLLLAFWVERSIWLVGLGLILAGLLWHAVARRLGRPASAG